MPLAGQKRPCCNACNTKHPEGVSYSTYYRHNNIRTQDASNQMVQRGYTMHRIQHPPHAQQHTSQSQSTSERSNKRLRTENPRQDLQQNANLTPPSDDTESDTTLADNILKNLEQGLEDVRNGSPGLPEEPIVTGEPGLDAGDGPNCSQTNEPDTNENQENEDSLPDDLALNVNSVAIDAVSDAWKTIKLIRSATIENSSLDIQTKKRLRDPPVGEIDDTDVDFMAGLKMYTNACDMNEKDYTTIRNIANEREVQQGRNPSYPSVSTVENFIRDVTGVIPVYDDMCINSCIAFTGIYKEMSNCSRCGEPRYNDQGKPRQRMASYPIAPQLQSITRSKTGAQDRRYRMEKTAEVLASRERNADNKPDVYDDVLCGSQYIDAVLNGDIQEHDFVIMWCADGMQLFKNKKSDTWIAIAIVFDISPAKRYKLRYVRPLYVIPGPNAPKDMDSFAFTTTYHMSAIMKEGFRYWDALEKRIFDSSIYLILVGADGPGMVYFTGGVGPHGCCGCRIGCRFQGRHKPGGPHYYAATLKPNDGIGVNSQHDDLDLWSDLGPPDPLLYRERLRKITSARTDREYTNIRRETGLSKPSILLGLPSSSRPELPLLFSQDAMHIWAINLFWLLMDLWRGVIECDTKTGDGDDKSTWDWAVLVKEVWKQHGQDVADVAPYLPGSFDRPTRNLAEKINSGIKAWESLLYLFGLAPALLMDTLPEPYLKNLCKFVRCGRILQQHSIRKDELALVNDLMKDAMLEFEELYYQRKGARLHMIRPFVHTFSHFPDETTRIGPAPNYSQWTTERTVGNIGREVAQPSNPFANLAERFLKRARLCSLISILPVLNDEAKHSSKRDQFVVSGGYTLLEPRDRDIYIALNPAHIYAYRQFYQRYASPPDLTIPPEHTSEKEWAPIYYRWSRLQLPNGQIARCHWKEFPREQDGLNVRQSRNVKIWFEDDKVDRFGEVLYYVILPVGNPESLVAVALVALYSNPNAEIQSRTTEVDNPNPTATHKVSDKTSIRDEYRNM